MTSFARLTSLYVLFSLTSLLAFGQKPHHHPAPATPDANAGAPAPGDGAQDQKQSPYRPYKELITKDAVTQNGLFKVHRLDDHVFFEIPTERLGRALLWQTEVAQLGQSTPGYPGTYEGSRVVRFTRRGTKVFLRSVDYSIRSAVDGATRLGVEENSLEPILMSFDIISEGDNKSPVIDVTPLFTSDPPDFSAKDAVGGLGVDPSRSYVDGIKAFQNNIETRSILTYVTGNMQNPFLLGPRSTASASTALVHYSLDILPETPMQGRLADSRIGYFTSSFTEYGRPENRAVARDYILRFRMEKKDPVSAVSEPVQPITYYISREVPEKWRPYIKKGVEAWNEAFEQAGFKNAIRCIDAPTPAQDPDWDEDDARYSVIRWAPSTTENAMGLPIADPRSGEVLSARIVIWHNILQQAEEWYFAQCAAIDTQAQKLPLPDDLMGKLVAIIVTHEVGHTLGLEHNMKASSAYTVAQLRDHQFVAKNGLAASVMDYARFNYVAQPGDDAMTIGRLGPYDKFAIEYGYKPIPEAKTPDEEKPRLDSLLAQQVTHPEFRFGDDKFDGIDPTAQQEDLSDDALQASRLGLNNIDLIAKTILLPASTKFGENYDRLAEMHAALFEQRMYELSHVICLIGGVAETDYHGGRGDDVFAPVAKDRQKKAVEFVVQRGVAAPSALFSPEILNKITPGGEVNFSTVNAKAMLTMLLAEDRLRRLEDNTALHKDQAYSIRDLVADISSGVWQNLSVNHPTFDIYERAIQRAYLAVIDARINGSSKSDTDLKPFEIADLKQLAKKLDGAVARTTDTASALHLQECRKDVDLILDNKFASSSSGGQNVLQMLFGFTHNPAFQPQATSVTAQNPFLDEYGRLPKWMVSELQGAH